MKKFCDETSCAKRDRVQGLGNNKGLGFSSVVRLVLRARSVTGFRV